MEVYNEGLYDLLRESHGTPTNTSEHVIIQHDAWGTMVTGMTCIEVSSLEQVSTLMAQANRQRSVGATDMNAASSRSHSVFAMYLKGTNESQSTELSGALHLVDLAGSERLDKSGAKGERLTETRNINKSLASLSHVFTAKAEGFAHVPFRNSKLTHLMEPCLSGQGKTLMLVNVNPDENEAHETMCSLRFARQVAQCNTGGKPRRNVKHLTIPGKGAAGKPQAGTRSTNNLARRASMSPRPRADTCPIVPERASSPMRGQDRRRATSPVGNLRGAASRWK
jgi:kinesin family protein C1